ncbi:transcriptional regulator [Dyadobacter sp. CY261]|nr:transcriptional regulator [Dyadobacter sp. CY261]
MNVREAEFTYIREKTGATAGNLSVQLSKLKEANYIEINKSFKDNYPMTVCSITDTGKAAFDTYVAALTKYIGKHQ